MPVRTPSAKLSDECPVAVCVSVSVSVSEVTGARVPESDLAGFLSIEDGRRATLGGHGHEGGLRDLGRMTL